MITLTFTKIPHINMTEILFINEDQFLRITSCQSKIYPNFPGIQLEIKHIKSIINFLQTVLVKKSDINE